MSWLKQFHTFANYNQRLNQQVYAAASKLSKAELEQNRGAFFQSILGTLNHILVGDLLWLNRFALLHSEQGGTFQSLNDLSCFPKPGSLNDILYSDFSELQVKRFQLDSLIKEWVQNELTEVDLELTLTYKNSKGIAASKEFGQLLSHLFNHQTHHRGQASTLLSQAGVDIGVTDYLVNIDQ